ncbi:MAG TPA: flagellar assembly protein FliH, partial [Bacillales bacterium]
KLSLPAAEGMRLLSKVIKSGNAKELYKNRKTIQLSNTIFEKEADYADSDFERDPVPILKRAEIEAKNIRRRAKEEAEELQRQIEQQRKQAEKDIEEALEEAKRKGWEQGYQLGLDEGKQQYEKLITDAKQTVDATKVAHQERLDETEYDILQLGLRIAGKIVGTVLPEEPERWLEMVKKAISEVKEYEEIRLIVHHKWYEFMLSHQKEFEALLKNSAEFYIYPEMTEDEFTCVIEFPSGRIDAGVDSQLSEIKSKLIAKLEET